MGQERWESQSSWGNLLQSLGAKGQSRDAEIRRMLKALPCLPWTRGPGCGYLKAKQACQPL